MGLAAKDQELLLIRQRPAFKEHGNSIHRLSLHATRKRIAGTVPNQASCPNSLFGDQQFNEKTVKRTTDALLAWPPIKRKLRRRRVIAPYIPI